MPTFRPQQAETVGWNFDIDASTGEVVAEGLANLGPFMGVYVRIVFDGPEVLATETETACYGVADTFDDALGQLRASLQRYEDFLRDAGPGSLSPELDGHRRYLRGRRQSFPRLISLAA